MDLSIFDEPPMRKSHQGPIETERDLLEELKTQILKLKEVLKREIAHKFILVERCRLLESWQPKKTVMKGVEC